jgi:hypothetical protein
VTHVVHALELVAPVKVENVPAGHAMHSLPDKYRPGVQMILTHIPCALAPTVLVVLPTAQGMHTLAFVAPTTLEYTPVGQSIHAEFPVTFLNFPATQVVQAPPSGPLYPALHLQELIPELILGASLFVGHVPHVGTK